MKAARENYVPAVKRRNYSVPANVEINTLVSEREVSRSA